MSSISTQRTCRQSARSRTCCCRLLLVDAALLSPPLNKEPLYLLLSGSRSKEAALWRNSCKDFRAEPVGESVGGAAEIKMLRSVVNKGLIMMFYKVLMAAEKMGQVDNFWKYVLQNLDTHLFESRIRLQILTSIIHRERRYHELKEVKELLENLGEYTNFVDCSLTWFERFRCGNFDDFKLPKDRNHYNVATFLHRVRDRLPTS